ncbi:hypothetical protein SERN_1752 [Serinibacter arcticus]|uniref:Uncharacterized protein n=1 Tax=Serinibacter arcticus TaxID=1655435 RepID=A0A4Z1E4B3_9MICO|nr:hypothetical protein SERN_1752 [Serinibacter arcticus]
MVVRRRRRAGAAVGGVSGLRSGALAGAVMVIVVLDWVR